MANEGIITLNDLNTRFNAAGVYTVIRDNSKTPRTPVVGTNRLIYGFSKVGIINAPFFIEKEDYETAESIYGPIDVSLERKGSWFHRSLHYALAEGNVLALNLLKTNNEIDPLTGLPTANADVSEYRSFSTDITEVNGDPTARLLASYYSKQRFWNPDPNYLLATRKVADVNAIFQVANISQNNYSFIVRKSEIKGFDVTALDWYGSANLIPKFIRPTDLISDFFIDVIVVNGNFGPENYAQLQIDPVYGAFFDGAGLKIGSYDAFINKAPIKKIYTGCLIPKFKDKNGTPYEIANLINRETTSTGVLAAINQKELDAYDTDTNVKHLDLIGHSLLSEPVIAADFLSYKRRIVQDFVFDQKLSNTLKAVNGNVGITLVSSKGKITVTINNNNPDFTELYNNIKLGTLFAGTTTLAGTAAGITISSPVLQVSKIQKAPTQIVFDVTNSYKSLETVTSGSFVDFSDIGTPTLPNIESIAVGDLVEVRIEDPAITILATYTVLITDTTASLIATLTGLVNAGTLTHFCTMTSTEELIDINRATGQPVTAFYFKVNATDTLITFADLEGKAVIEVGATIPNYRFESTNDRFYLDGTNTYYVGDLNSPAVLDWTNGQLQNGDKVTDGIVTHYLKFEKNFALSGLDVVDDGRDLVKISFFLDQDLVIPIIPGAAINFGTSVDSFGYPITDPTKIDFISLIGVINKRFDATVVTTKSVRVDIQFEPEFKVGQFLVGIDSNSQPMMARILRIKRFTLSGPIPTHIEIETDNPVKIFTSITASAQVERYLPLKEMFLNYDLTYLKGYVLTASHLPNNTNERMQEIVRVMTDTNMADALIDPEMTDFRYTVDTFNHGLEPFSKSYVANMVKKRQKCLGIFNTPSMQEFKDSVDPRFTDTPTAVNPLPELAIQYIADGANLIENPSFLYSLPTEDQGASFCGFFSPNLGIREPDGNEFMMPPAAIVSNNFVKKYIGGNPFKPVAGPNYGILSADGLIGTEFPLSKPERGLLEQFGINPIFKKKDGRIMIMGNETAYKTFRSTLNQLNSRDTLVTLEIDIENLLFNYTFEFNDDTLKTQIESVLTTYLSGIRDGFGAITTFTIVFDRTNNPQWVANEGAALVDIEVRLPDVVKKFINRITLTRGQNPVVGAFTAI